MITVSAATRYLRRSFLGVLGVLISSMVLIYSISPRRDPSFVPTSSNAGSTVAWVANIPESVWINSSAVIAGLVAVHLVLLALNTPSVQHFMRNSERFSRVRLLMSSVVALFVCVGLTATMWFGLVLYLLTQSIVD